MKYSIEIREWERAQYVHVVLEGRPTLEDMMQGRESLNESIATSGCGQVLIDNRGLTSKLPLADDFSFTSEHGINLPRSVMFAVLVPSKDKDYYMFIENVAQNRGINLRIFTDHEQSLAWLISQ